MKIKKLVQQLKVNDNLKSSQGYLVRKPGEAEQEDNDDEHLDHLRYSFLSELLWFVSKQDLYHSFLVGKHGAISQSISLSRCPDVECDENEKKKKYV